MGRGDGEEEGGGGLLSGWGGLWIAGCGGGSRLMRRAFGGTIWYSDKRDVSELIHNLG